MSASIASPAFPASLTASSIVSKAAPVVPPPVKVTPLSRGPSSSR
eukprot:COSAG04_NODE_351_length_16103_cov_3.615413_4_plen_45_part_00